jgi:hypothetical protein
MSPVSDAPPPVARPYTPTALPSVTARVLAFAAILIGGLCGGLIGYSVTDLQCGASDRPVAEAPADSDDGCGTVLGIGALVGALMGAGGVAVIAVLVLRAMAEWRRNLETEDAQPGP